MNYPSRVPNYPYYRSHSMGLWAIQYTWMALPKKDKGQILQTERLAEPGE